MPATFDFASYAKRVSRANRQVHGTPTPAQMEAGNFRTGKLHLHGLDLRIEIARGGIRTGTSPDGKKWKRVMTCPYGRIKRTVGLDGEAVDFFLGEHPESQLCFVISQLDSDGNLDEHKCVLGTRNVKEAKRTYLSNYPDGWENERVGEIRGYFLPEFRKWLKTDAPHKNRNKSAREYVEGEDCPYCGAELERDPRSGTCNGCGKAWGKKIKSAAVPHDDGEVSTVCHACGQEERTGGDCLNCGAIRPMVESRLARTEQGLPSAVRVKGAEESPGECPKCREFGEPEWKNEVLAICRKCDHTWFAHVKRSAFAGLLNGPKVKL